MEHDQLIEEMATIDRLTTAERLRLARKRRGQQLKRWAQRERETNLKKKAGTFSDPEKTTKLFFASAVMLLESAARNDVDEVRRLLELGVSPDSTNEDGLTALHQCCIDDSEEMMKVLVEFGANVNAADSEQWTPLHAAATCGHLHLVKFLIENGANLLAVNGDGNMPYDICEDETTLSFIENEMAKQGVTQELIDNTRSETETRMLKELTQLAEEFGDLEFRDMHGATPLHTAAANGYLLVLDFLLDNHCSTEVTDLDLWQPLHAAACWGHLEAVEILAQNGADISALTKSGETPFDITEDPDIKDRLVELAEQRLRLAEPRVKRGRSSSTRTHSIRRTSLRDKMKTTKKDVTEEGLLYMKSVHKPPQEDSLQDNIQALQDVVDVGDVQISIPGSFNNPGKPVQLVPPLINKTPEVEVPVPPVRPSRSEKSRQSSFDENTNITASLVQQQTSGAAGSPNSKLWSNSNGGNSGEPINIHVSVTINPGMVGPGGTYSTGTLADLKRNRSQNRLSGSNSSSNLSLSSSPAAVEQDPGGGGARLQQLQQDPQPSSHSPVSHPKERSGSRDGSFTVSLSPTTGRKKFAASSVEVVGPPGKRGCCQII